MSKKNKYKNIIFNIMKVTTSNIIKLFAGVVVGFILPKIIGVSDYGYHKTFTLYATYVSLLSFGIVDGIYLKYGGKNYDQLNREQFRLYSKAFIVLQVSIALIGVFIANFFLQKDAKFILICLAIFLIANNVTAYFQTISTITARFSELTFRNVIQSVLNIIAVLVLWGIYHIHSEFANYKVYTIFYVLIFSILAIWYVYTYRNIVFGKNSKWVKERKNIRYFAIIGCPLMVANICSSLVLSLDRQFVNILFDKKTYALYAFAYNMLALVTTATSAISTVLYPTLKRENIDSLKKSYSILVGVVLLIVYGCIIIYYPLCIFVNWYLPQYSNSLIIFQIIFPGLAISSVITIVMHNYYKTLGINLLFFFKGIFALILSAVANAIAYYCFKTTQAISIASIITLIIWYCVVEYYFINNMNVKYKENFIYMILMMLFFYSLNYIIQNLFVGCIIYGIGFVLISYSIYKKEIRNFLNKFNKVR